MILLVSAAFPPEPIVSAVIMNDIATALSENWKVIVLTPKPSRPFGFKFDIQTKVKDIGFQHIVLNSYTCPEDRILGRIRESYSFGKYAAEYIRKHSHEISLIYIDAWPILAQYIIIRNSKKLSIPTVIHIDDIYPESLTNKIPYLGKLICKLLLPVDKFMLKNASKVVAISQNMHSILSRTRKIPGDKIDIVQNWQNENKFLEFHNSKISVKKDDTPNMPFTFMYFGNIGPVAGVDFLIKSFASANLKDTSLVIAGSGSRKIECIRLADSYKSSSIIFLDVPAGSEPELIDRADTLLLPVKKGAAMSSIPSKLIAYMFAKKSIIACVDDGSDSAMVVKMANCGWVVSPEDPDSLVKMMEFVISLSRMELDQMGKNGFEYAMRNFSKKSNLQKVLKIIGENLKS